MQKARSVVWALISKIVMDYNFTLLYSNLLHYFYIKIFILFFDFL